MTETEIKDIREYLSREWRYNVHKKYHKYFDEWFSNVTETQMLYFKCWMKGQLTPYTRNNMESNTKNMTPEEKKLLTKYICARIPHNVNVNVEYNGEVYNVLGYTNGKLIIVKPFMSNAIGVNVEECKPYLRPMDSMTDEERDYITKFAREPQKEEWTFPHRAYEYLDLLMEWNMDFMGLIDMGLALPAKEDTYRNYGTSEKHI